MLKLYHHGTFVCAAKPRIVLVENGLAWTGHYVDILKGEQFTPAHAKLNLGRIVATLVHGVHVIRESTLTCKFLDEVLPDPPLKPSSPVDVWRCASEPSGSMRKLMPPQWAPSPSPFPVVMPLSPQILHAAAHGPSTYI